jgi:hypothetical protein
MLTWFLFLKDSVINLQVLKSIMTELFINNTVNRFAIIHILLFSSFFCFSQTTENNADRIIIQDAKVINVGMGENSLQPESEPKIVNLGGKVDFPEVKLEPQSIKIKNPDIKVNQTPQDIWNNLPKGERHIQTYTYDELDKMGKITHEESNWKNTIYYYILIFLILYFLVYIFRNSIRSFLIFILAPLFRKKVIQKSNNAFDRNEKISVNDKITALKEIETLYSKGIIDETEFKSLKSQILN